MLKVKRQKIILGCVIAIITLLLIYTATAWTCWRLQDDKQEHWIITKEDQTKEKVTLTDISPRYNSIFMVETSGRSNFHPLQLCTIESAAKHHPLHQVYVVMRSNVLDWTSPISGVFNQSNIIAKHLNFESFVRQSKLSELWESNQIQASKYLVSHLSDILRFLLLERFGGTYLDLDQVITKPLPPVANLIGQESSWAVGAGVMRFSIKHPILDMFLEELRTSFDGSDWGNNGPALVLRVLSNICKVNALDLMSEDRCAGIKIYQPRFFYPLHWTDWRDLFDPGKKIKTLEMIKDAFSVHTWGKQSLTSLTHQDLISDHAFASLAKEHCPITWSHVTEAS